MIDILKYLVFMPIKKEKRNLENSKEQWEGAY